MNQRDSYDVQFKLEEMRKLAEEIEALTYKESPKTSEKMRKIAAYSGRIATCLRLHGQIPEERHGPAIVEAAKNVHQITRGLRQLANHLPRKDI